MADEHLKTYRRKRDFKTTPEPAGSEGAAGGGAAAREPRTRRRTTKQAGLRFTVQEHHARRLHWDLRLEHDGTLASWAIPNGIPQEPADNRLAVRTEDHPLQYLEFEGEIPAGEYGAGTMRVWDTGHYELHKWNPGKIEITFHGGRLSGRYALFALGSSGSRGRRAGSEADGQGDWMIHRMDPPADPDRQPMPERIVPMLARATTAVPQPEADWSFELKWDGVRAIAYLRPGRLRLESRNQREITDRYPEIRGLLRQLGMREAVLDGEIVAFDGSGKPSFERLQRRMHVTSAGAIRRLEASTPVVYAIFDLLYLDGRALIGSPYEERREQLELLGLKGPAWQVPKAHRGGGTSLFEATRERGLEGLIAKRFGSCYEPGRRSGAWLKIKHRQSQELVIGGWLPGEGRRTDRIGALLLGYHEDGELVFAGRVGTGFTERTLDELARRLAPVRTHSSPFRRGLAPPKQAVFVRPELVAQVEFAEWTAEGVLRVPSFKGLVPDRAPAAVRREPLAETLEEAPAETLEEAPAETLEEAPAETPEEPPAETPEEAPAETPEDGPVQTPGDAAAKTPGDAPAAREPAPVADSRPESLFAHVRSLPDGTLSAVVDGRSLKFSNWDKVLFPETGFTKGELIAYYARVAETALVHLRDRALTLKRYPNGVESSFFYEKQSPSHRPEWVETCRIAGIDYTLAQDRPTLVWLANLADIELHTSLSRAQDPGRPTMIMFDLDPGPPADIVRCCEVALVLGELFERLGLEALAKTSGSKGMQVCVPLNTPVTYAVTKSFARRLADLLEQRLPDLVTARMTKHLRPGKVLVDWSQNDEHKTTVTAYSVRARERPTVSTPVSWEEVARCRREADPELLSFTTAEVLRRLAEQGDLLASLESLQQELPATG
jgi:bifunctional non-homologous end joining protein LigD